MYNLPKDYLSPSQIEKYLRCPKQYQFTYVDNVPIVKNENLVIGSAFAYGIQVFNQARQQTVGNEPTKDEVLKAARWKAKLEGEEMQTEMKPEEVNYIIDTITASYFDWLKDGNDQYAVAQAEQPVSFEIDGIEIKCVPDLVKISFLDLRPTIIDYKTATRSKWSKDVIMHNLQTSLYSLALGIKTVGIHEVKKPKMLKNGWSEVVVSEQVVDKTEHALSNAVHAVKAVAKGIHEEVFPMCDPSNNLCNAKYCSYWTMCRGLEL